MTVDEQKYKEESASFVDRIRDVVMLPTCWRGAIDMKCLDRIFEHSAILVGEWNTFSRRKGYFAERRLVIRVRKLSSVHPLVWP